MKLSFTSTAAPTSRVVAALAAMVVAGSAAAQTSTYASMRADMETLCPVAWEDMGVAMNEAIPSGDVWAGDTTDRAAFVAHHTSEGMSTVDADLLADTIDGVSTVCASARLGLVDFLMAKTTSDVNNALAGSGGGGVSRYLGAAWSTGDVRTTSRLTAADGWVFLVGQTVGASDSGADLAGSTYQALFDLAVSWGGDNAGKTWGGAGELGQVTLPDLRGRTVYAADNMSGTSADVLTDASADQIGGVVGDASVLMSEAQMPSHTHSMQNGGVHNHSMSTNGNHEHKLRSSVYTGSSAGRSDWKFFEGKARPNYQNTINWGGGAVAASGNHNHTIHNSSSHSHVNDATGGSEPLETVSPGIVFNVEMKY